MTGSELSDDINHFLKCSEEVRARLGLCFQSVETNNATEPMSLRDLRDLAMMQNLFYPTKFVSHRKLVGPIIVFLKECVIKVLDPVLRHRLARQFEINQFTWNMAKLMREQNERILQLKTRIDVLESRSK